MASFWENFAEAMGWGKANHTNHLSDISEEKRQENRNRYVDSAVKSGDNKGLEIKNAKNRGGDWFTSEDDPFVGEFASDNAQYETRVYNFEYEAPTSGKDMDGNDYERETRSGKVLVRVPKGDNPHAHIIDFNGSSPYFDEENMKSNNFGVYEAVLDDGTVLDAEQFRDLVYANPYYRSHTSWNSPYFNLGEQDFVDSKDKLKDFKDYIDTFQEKKYQTKWDKNWRGWKATNPPSKDLYHDGPHSINLYFKPGPNGE